MTTRQPRLFYISLLFLWGSCNLTLSGNAEMIPDTTLPNPSIVNKEAEIHRLTGGTTAGNHLFHSFETFSLPTGETAFFDNSPTIENIITRVTGGQLSTIDGLIQANGTADLFFINPSGILFGENARLDIGGSFIASTADSILFEDNSIYSAINPETPPLLTVSLPLGVQLGENPGEIHVEGSGHALTAPSILSPIVREDVNAGLAVAEGNTLALIGGKITLAGGLLTAPGGRIELSAVNGGKVGFTPILGQGWTLNFAEVETFQDIQLLSLSLVDTSGEIAGSISAQGRNIHFEDGSLLLIQNLGTSSAGDITLKASELVDMTGILLETNIRSGLDNETLASGAGGNIIVETQNLRFLNGAQITAATFGEGKGGNIELFVSESIQLGQPFNVNPTTSSLISAVTFSHGNSGDVNVETQTLQAFEGASISALSRAEGNGGNLTVTASDSIELQGFNFFSRQPSALASSTFSQGNAGQLTVNTGRLLLADGGRISSSTFAQGNAGSVVVNASESITIRGLVTQLSSSAIESSGVLVSERAREILRLPPMPTGDAGDVTVTTPNLQIRDNNLVGVRNDGEGNAGTLTINADSIFLDDEGRITASTFSGEGGNITLQVEEFMQLRNGSQISAEAGGVGNGGNLTINSPIVVALENSDIVANAFEGSGGNIAINAQGIFGTEFREEVTPESDITASSEFGLSGTVTINNPEVEPASGLVELPTEVVDNSDRIITGCAAAEGNSFTITGRGGIPENPMTIIRGTTIWQDLQDFSAPNSRMRVSSETPQTANSSLPVEATSWIMNAQGNLELVANVASVPNFSPKCSALSS